MQDIGVIFFNQLDPSSYLVNYTNKILGDFLLFVYCDKL